MAAAPASQGDRDFAAICTKPSPSLYGVTFQSFCYYALKIAHADEEARSFTHPTEDVLEHLSVGLGIPIDELRGFETRRRRNVARLYAELEAWIDTPEGQQKYEQAFAPRV